MVTPSGTVGEIVWNQYDRTPDPLNWLSFFFNPKARLTVDHTDFKTVKRYSNIFADMEMKMGFKFPNPKQEEYKYPGLADFWKDEAFERFGPIFLMIYPVYGKYTKGSPNIFIIRNPSLKTLSFQKVMDPFITLYTLNGWLDQGGCKMILEFPNGRVVESFDLNGKEVTHEITPPRIKAKLKAQQEAAKAAKLKKMNAEGDLVIPKEYREVVTKALKIARFILEENKQPTWIVDLAQGKNKAKQIDWLLRNIVESK